MVVLPICKSQAENDRYVVYNYQDDIWYVGSLDRTAWLDRGIFSLPIGAGADNYCLTTKQGQRLMAQR